MKFTLSWLRDHLDTQASLDSITETLTRIGLEVEGVADKARDLQGYVIASVISAEQHPNADRLRVCLVETGEGAPVQVVCGAPNARAGMRSVFAPPGTFIPGKNLTLGVGTIRGVESRGMLVSAFELGLSDDHEGIIDLPADAPVGMAYPAYAGLDDPVIDINLTPNRPDCASVRGIARDLAAAGLGTLKPDPAPATLPGDGACPVQVRLDFAAGDEKLCPAFGLRLVRGVKNGPSPDWLQKRLIAIGLRPINALVDITNFITFDRGRPLHVFDARKVSGELVVRRARAEEGLLALDGRRYALDPSMVVIADENGPESLAGIMGGEQSGCDASTTDVLIESALWDPLTIAQTGRRLGIVTDARYRFERGVDPAFVLPGLHLATRMVLDLCGGEASEIAFAGHREQPAAPEIDFPFADVRRLSGLDIAPQESLDTLTKLGFRVSEGAERAVVVPPSWRPDIEGKADLVEEVVRIAGLDRIAPVPLARLEASVVKPMLTLIQKRTRLAKRVLASRGLVEAVTWSFIAKPDAVLFGGGDDALALANPIAADLSDMRPSLLPGLIKAAQRNADRGFSDVALFEVGQCFASDLPEGQTIRAAAIRRGTARHGGAGRHWNGSGPVDAFDAKADAFALLAALGIPTGGLQVVPGGADWLHPGRSAKLQFGPKTVVGVFGELHPRALKALDVKGPLVGFEITLDALPPPKAKATKVKPALVLSDYQPVSRDFAFVVARDVAAIDIVKAAQSAERQLIVAIDVFDLYEGAGIEPGQKSVAIAVTLQPKERTLTDAEIDALSARIVAEVGKKTGAVLRG